LLHAKNPGVLAGLESFRNLSGGLAILLRILVAFAYGSTKRLAGYFEEDNDLLAWLAPESSAIGLHWFVANRASQRCH
jgi:hypothetical protein